MRTGEPAMLVSMTSLKKEKEWGQKVSVNRDNNFCGDLPHLLYQQDQTMQPDSNQGRLWE